MTGRTPTAVCAVVPVKSFKRAKSRLAAVLPGSEREDLARRLFQHTLTVVVGHEAISGVLVVSNDAAVLDLASAGGAETVIEPSGAGLNAAIELAVRRAIGTGAAAVAILPADLPLLNAADVSALIAGLPSAGPAVVIAPDRRDSGTNALLCRPPGALAPGFGERSFSRHLEACRQKGIVPVIVKSEGLALDIDVPEDLYWASSFQPRLLEAIGELS
jgi:2-phospho-L-lactate guanylyltransferase